MFCTPLSPFGYTIFIRTKALHQNADLRDSVKIKITTIHIPNLTIRIRKQPFHVFFCFPLLINYLLRSNNRYF
jgi:hypothetical protein